MRRLALLVLLLPAPLASAQAGEGMWIPMLIGQQNIEEMQRMGFRLSAQDVFSATEPSLKDAVVLFGNRCTGAIISPHGLLITNHHCGFAEIQGHSTVTHNLLEAGFWADSPADELPNPGLTVKLLVSMEEVTQRALRGVADTASEAHRALQIAANSAALADSATQGTHLIASVEPFYHGNQFFLLVYEEFPDVRLVGTPPTAIGKFGGDTDNWVWPRHTGDFALFRIYADSSNNPAPYSPSNVPFRPRRYLPISAQGVTPGDFTLVYGFPARTQQFLVSQAVDHLTSQSNPLRIRLRRERLDIYESFMSANDTVRIQYASRRSRASNAWKKWMGQRQGLIRLNAVERKRQQEREFAQWVQANPQRQDQHGHLLPRFEALYQAMNPLSLLNDIGNETFRAVELLAFASRLERPIRWALYAQADSACAQTQALALGAMSMARAFYRLHHPPLGQQVFARLMPEFYALTPPEHHPEALRELIGQAEGCWERAAQHLFASSALTDSVRLLTALANLDAQRAQQLANDPAFRLFAQLDSLSQALVRSPLFHLRQSLEALYRAYVMALKEMHPQRRFYPDANFTLRVAYGRVEGYRPRDAVEYRYRTTLDGVAQKARLPNPDYAIPQRLLDLHAARDYGQWATNDTLTVNFIASNHTSGGNSGSPIINAYGHLVGINFDRVWEGTMSDIMFYPARCRNIAVDARYILFLVERFAQAHHLLEEMTVVHAPGEEARTPSD